MSKTIVITGGTGYIGSAIVKQLVARGDTVIAIVRSDASAAKVEALGATALRGELTDADVLRKAAEGADGAIQVAATGDANAPAADVAVARAFLAGLSGKPYVHTGGVWVYGDTGGPVDDTAPIDPPSLVAWRIPVQEEVVAAGGVVIHPGVVLGYGGGIPESALVAGDAVQYVGDGSVHWSLVHVDDLAALYVLALDRAAPGSVYVGASQTLTVAEIAEAIAKADGKPGATRGIPVDDVRANFGAFGEALLLDQQVAGVNAERDLGWKPEHTDLAASLANG